MINQSSDTKNSSSIAALRRFVRSRVTVEHCDMCNVEIPDEHTHLLEPNSRKIHCACRACAILFDSEGSTKFRRVPTRVRYLSEFNLTDAQWDDLMIPIQMAFFFNSTPDERIVALYPGPAGATESLLTLEAWQKIVAENPTLEQMQPDVEALLVNRVGKTRDYFVVPIDECYKLIGLIRTHWSGLSGGTEVWREIAKFYTALRERAVEVKNA